MFARQLWRPARTLQREVHRFASQKSPGKKIDTDEPSNAILYSLAGGASLMFGYMWFRSGEGQLTKGGAPALSPVVEKDIFGAMFKYQFFDPEQGFVSLPLEKSEIINHNTKKLTFAFESEKMRSGLPVASAVIAKYKGPDMEKPLIRPYTPVSDDKQRGTIDFIIKKYPNGPMSTHMHDLQPGQRIEFRGPLPKYAWKPNMHEHIALIAGGTGITPMWQIAHGIFSNPEDKTKVTLVFGNLSEEDIILKKEWEHLENTYPQRFKAFYVLDNPPQQWQGGKGHITKQLLKTVLPEPKEGEKIKIFVCGPPGLYKAISGTKKSVYDQGEVDGLLKDLGYSKDQVYKF